MKCPYCFAEVLDSAKFCSECGTPIADTPGVSAPETDRANLLQKHIPPELAKRIFSAGVITIFSNKHTQKYLPPVFTYQ